MTMTWVLAVALSLLSCSLVHGRNIRGTNVEHEESPKVDFHKDEWDAVSNKTMSTLVYTDGSELHRSLNTNTYSGSSFPKDMVYSTGDKRVKTATDVINSERKTYFDVGAISSQEEEKPTEHQHSHRKLASTQIKIKNNCDEKVDVRVVYKNSGSSYSIGRKNIAPNSESSVAATNDPEFFLYGKSSSHEWAGDSEWCFTGGSPCFEKVSLSGNPNRFTYTLRCDGGNSSPPAGGGGGNNNNGGNNGSNGGNSGGGQSMTARDQLWLQEHNSRRQTWHGNDYVPLQWSNAIKNSAQAYADKLINRSGCRISHGFDGDRYGGENLAANWGGGGQRPPSNILTRWVENEADLPFNQKLHFTQVIWKATTYLGCAEASKPYNGGQCHIQVCRYIRPGNCNVSASNYAQKMLERTSPCTPFKPSDA